MFSKALFLFFASLVVVATSSQVESDYNGSLKGASLLNAPPNSESGAFEEIAELHTKELNNQDSHAPEAFSDAINDMVQVESKPSLLERAKSWFRNKVEAAKDMSKDAMKKIKATGKNALEKINNAMEKVKAAGKNAMDKVKAAGNNVMDKVKATGKNVMDKARSAVFGPEEEPQKELHIPKPNTSLKAFARREEASSSSKIWCSTVVTTAVAAAAAFLILNV